MPSGQDLCRRVIPLDVQHSRSRFGLLQPTGTISGSRLLRQLGQARVNVELAGHHLSGICAARGPAQAFAVADSPKLRPPPPSLTSEASRHSLRGRAGHDVDYYAWEVVRILKIADKVVRAGLRGRTDVERAQGALREEAPLLESFRNQVTHVEDIAGVTTSSTSAMPCGSWRAGAFSTWWTPVTDCTTFLPIS